MIDNKTLSNNFVVIYLILLFYFILFTHLFYFFFDILLPRIIESKQVFHYLPQVNSPVRILSDRRQDNNFVVIYLVLHFLLVLVLFCS